MPLYTQLPSVIKEVYIIIAGGGTAGCIIASRLSNADQNLSILVIEWGPNNVGIPTVEVPALFLHNLSPDSKTVQFYKGGKSKFLCAREPIVPTANVLGGGSSVNMLTYSRAQRCDMDSWQVPGWSADDLLPYMKKLETYHGPGSEDQHGYDGPIHISGGTYRSFRAENSFMSAINKVGWPEIEDLSNLDIDGERQDTASRYLHPTLQTRLNLHVVVESRAKQVLFDDGRASSVVFESNQTSEHSNSTRHGNIWTVKAKKMVILCCGAFGTPPILERSGIGNPEVLKRAGVKSVVSETPGVGDGYQDHHEISYAYKSSLTPRETLDGLANGNYDVEELISNNDAILGWNCMGVTCKLRPNDTAEIAALRPEFQAEWDKEFADNPNKPLAIITQVNAHPTNPMGVPVGQYMGASTISVYPSSRGYLHITGPELADPIDFDAGFFSDPGEVDVKKCRWSYKKQREIMRRMDVFRGEMADYHPPFPNESAAKCVETDGPLLDPPDIQYSAEDDAIIDQWIREHVSTTWHSLGTCKMAPLEEKGVVDPYLNVYGVTALKVADLSIVPKNIGANTANMAMVIGEKAADIVIAELGIREVE